MFFPYNTDAPIYHWPIVTVAMIVVNTVVFVAMLMGAEDVTPWILEYGDGLHPVQWITSNFIHGGIGHLIGNMICLWSFGLVIEGKLGWYKTLAVFLGIGIGQCAIEQTVMLGASEGGSFGASAIIFGLMAMSLIWAPENEMQCLLLFSWHPFYFDISIKVLVGLLLVLELVVAGLAGLAMTSSALHLMGAGFGFAVSLWMLKAGMVDCENWDIFSVWAGRHTMSREMLEKLDAESPEQQQKRKERLERRRTEKLTQIRQAIAEGQPALALAVDRRMTREIPEWILPEADLVALIKAFHQKKLWMDSVPAMVEYISRNADKTPLMRLNLARILVVEGKRPLQALKVMAKIDPATLDAAQQGIFEKLRAKARQLQEQDPYEVANEDW